MQTDPTGWKESTILDYLPNREIEIGNRKYTCFLEEKVNVSDRCFAFTVEDEPEKKFLFQITENTEDKNVSRANLESIALEDDETMWVLVKTGQTILKELPPEVLRTDVLRRHIPLHGKRYTVSYQSPDVSIAGISLEDQYAKKVIGRQ